MTACGNVQRTHLGSVSAPVLCMHYVCVTQRSNAQGCVLGNLGVGWGWGNRYREGALVAEGSAGAAPTSGSSGSSSSGGSGGGSAGARVERPGVGDLVALRPELASAGDSLCTWAPGALFGTLGCCALDAIAVNTGFHEGCLRSRVALQ